MCNPKLARCCLREQGTQRSWLSRLRRNKSYAHKVEPLDELADAFCRVGTASPSLRWQGDHPAHAWTTLRADDICLLHLVAAPPHLHDAYPSGTSSGFMQTGTASGVWSALSPQRIAASFDALPARSGSSTADPALQPQPWLGASLILASLNTLSRRQTGAYTSCALQMERHGIALLGLR